MEWNVYKTEFEQKAQAQLNWMHVEFSKVTAGRPNVKLFEDILVDAYDSKIRLYELANLQLVEGKQLLIKPYDKTLVVAIAKAILKENLNFNPLTDPDLVRIVFPNPTEESRKNAVKKIKEFLEKNKIAIRVLRKEIHNKIKKDEELREDELKNFQRKLDELTKAWNDKLQAAFVAKEKELMHL